MSLDLGGQAGFLDARAPGSAVTPLSQRADPSTSDLSPDGKKLAYVIDNRIRVFQQVYFNSTWKDVAPDHLFSAVRWSPSGRYLAAVGAPPVLDPTWPKGAKPNRGDVPGTVYIVDLETNAVRPLWVPDGTPRPPLPPARPAIQFVSWSPDEQYVPLPAAADAMQVVAFDPATGRTTELLHDPLFAEEALHLSEDGTTILFVRRHTDRPLLEMWTASVDGTNAHALWSYTPYWTPNDAYTPSYATYRGVAAFDAVAWSR